MTKLVLTIWHQSLTWLLEVRENFLGIRSKMVRFLCNCFFFIYIKIPAKLAIVLIKLDFNGNQNKSGVIDHHLHIRKYNSLSQTSIVIYQYFLSNFFWHQSDRLLLVLVLHQTMMNLLLELTNSHKICVKSSVWNTSWK